MPTFLIVDTDVQPLVPKVIRPCLRRWLGSAASSLVILSSAASWADVACTCTLEFLIAFHSCLACATVIGETLIARANDFPMSCHT